MRGGNEFLDFEPKSNSAIKERIESVFRIKQTDSEEEEEVLSNKARDATPPWKKEPINFDDSILTRTKNFLSRCNSTGDEPVIENNDFGKEVIMNVHLGVFDVNGKIPEDDILERKNIVNVSVPHSPCFEGRVNCDPSNRHDNISSLILKSEEDSDSEYFTKAGVGDEMGTENVNKGLVQVISSFQNEQGDPNLYEIQ